MTRHTCYTALAPLAVFIIAASQAPQAFASGFQLREQSPSAQGTSFAGVTAGGADIGSMFFNPAALPLFQGHQAVIGFSYVMPKAKLENASGTRTSTSSISGSDSVSNAAQSALLPNIYALWSVTPDLKFGLSVNAPFGMGTEYDSDFVGRYHALKSDLKVVDLAPSIAYRLSPQWSIGAAFVARKAEAELTNAVDFGRLIHAPGGSYDGTATLKGSKWAKGYRLGVVFEPTETVRLGLAYHSASNITLDGDATYHFAHGTPGGGIAALKANGFVNGPATAELRLPSTTSLGIQADLSPAFSLQGEIAKTTWSTFKELRVKFDSDMSNSVTEEKWRDTWFFALGLTWKATDAWTLRTGVAYDQSAVKNKYRTPRIPDGNRTWLSLGAGYAFSQKASMDFAYTHIFVTDGPLELRADSKGNTYRGNLNGKYKNSIDILSAQVRFQF